MPHPNGRPTSAELLARAQARRDWFSAAHEAALRFLETKHYLEGGEITRACREAGVGEPRHHNLWVTLVGVLEQEGHISKRAYVPPTTPQSHIFRIRSWESQRYRGTR